MKPYIIGIDCSTHPENVGLSRAFFEDGRWRIVAARCASAVDLPLDMVLKWHEKMPISLLALNAPLGWPATLGPELMRHRAGEPFGLPMNELFCRTTDDENRLERTPMYVGAHAIARTAWAALELLGQLRERSGQSIPLAWETGLPAQLSAIEVNPIGTWLALTEDRDDAAPKRATPPRPRAREVLERIASLADVAEVQSRAAESPHILDAILCVVAGINFINGDCQPPQDLELARKEGWIWV